MLFPLFSIRVYSRHQLFFKNAHECGRPEINVLDAFAGKTTLPVCCVDLS